MTLKRLFSIEISIDRIEIRPSPQRRLPCVVANRRDRRSCCSSADPLGAVEAVLDVRAVVVAAVGIETLTVIE